MKSAVLQLDPERRRDQFEAVQRIFAENLPALYFAASV